jgi:GTP-binding protein
MSSDARADPLVIRSLEFLGGLAAPGGWRPEHTMPEVAFAGRSNVGKSSLINKLVRRKKLARVSNTPGRTREVNFFRVNDQFVLVDLPGYGYARVSKDMRATWRPLIEGVLRDNPRMRGVVQLLDARHDPSQEDLQMLEFLAELGTPAIIVATKVDKVPKSGRDARLAALAAQAGIESDQMIPFSAVTGEGRDELAEAVAALVAEKG